MFRNLLELFLAHRHSRSSGTEAGVFRATTVGVSAGGGPDAVVPDGQSFVRVGERRLHAEPGAWVASGWVAPHLAEGSQVRVHINKIVLDGLIVYRPELCPVRRPVRGLPSGCHRTAANSGRVRYRPRNPCQLE